MPATAVNGPRPSIVLVEDDAFIAGLYVAKLTRERYAVELATDGEMGLDLIRRVKPDLVLLDILLPKKNGWDVLVALKKDPLTKGIPVLILSNAGKRSDIENGLALGAVGYIVKVNHTPAEVVAKIDQILRRGALRV